MRRTCVLPGNASCQRQRRVLPGAASRPCAFRELPSASGPNVDDAPALTIAIAKATRWPTDAVEQVCAVAELLASSQVPLSIDEIGSRFTAVGPWRKCLPQLLGALVALEWAEAHCDQGYGVGQ